MLLHYIYFTFGTLTFTDEFLCLKLLKYFRKCSQSKMFLIDLNNPLNHSRITKTPDTIINNVFVIDTMHNGFSSNKNHNCI